MNRQFIVFVTLYVGLLVSLLTGCNSNPGRDGTVKQEKFDLRSLAKGDIDSVLEVHVREARAYCRELMEKLYKRNPRELNKNQLKTIDENLVRVFDLEHQWDFSELHGKRNIEAIRLTFDDEYNGDRVFSFMVGITSMIMAAYEDKTEFYLFDQVEPQKLYNSARNIEIAVWKTGHDRDVHGELYLYSNSLPGEVSNLSYERLFGKLIALQDTMAIIMEGKTNRVIKKVIQKMATAVFLPI